MELCQTISFSLFIHVFVLLSAFFLHYQTAFGEFYLIETIEITKSTLERFVNESAVFHCHWVLLFYGPIKQYKKIRNLQLCT